MDVIEVAVPDIGDFEDVEIIEVLVAQGDDISIEQSLITVESDKASMEIPSSAKGKVQELKVKVGDKVSKGTVIATLAASGEAAPAAEPRSAPPTAPAGGESKVGAKGEKASKDSASDTGSGGRADRSGRADSAGNANSDSKGETEVQVPDIGDFEDVEVIEVLVAAGDTIGVEQSLITVESDKASMEIPSSAAGRISKLLIKVGDKVSKGTPIAIVAGDGGTAAASEAAAKAPAPAPSGSPAPAAAAPASAAAASPRPAAPTKEEPGATAGAAQRAHPVPAEMRDGKLAVKPHASPSVRLFARELGVDLSLVTGTGPKERITADDVKGFVKRVVKEAAAPSAGVAPAGAGAGLNLLAWPKVDFARYGEIEVKPLSRIKKISSANLHRNWVMIPHVTNHDDADITDLEAFRVRLNAENAKSGAKLTMLAFLVKACVAALKKFPEFNSSLEGESLVYKRYYHIGFAADTPNGLMVPVVKDADSKGLFDIAAEMAELAKKARDGKVAPADMQGGTFSISSLGGIGGTYFTPIINAPEVAILGVCRSATRPVWSEDKGTFAPRLILPLSLSWDHRVIDGAAAARFNAFLAQLLGDFRRIVL